MKVRAERNRQWGPRENRYDTIESSLLIRPGWDEAVKNLQLGKIDDDSVSAGETKDIKIRLRKGKRQQADTYRLVIRLEASSDQSLPST